jgi:hypothetical protein
MQDFKKVRNVYLEDNLKISLYENKDRFKNISDEIVDIVHKNMNDIASDDSYAFHILKKIMPHEKVIKEILTYELLNYSPSKKVDSFDEFVKTAISSLHKFQYKVGGFSIEDIDWILNDESSQRFKVKKGENILYNSIENKYCDKELLWFLESIVSYVQEFSDEYKIKFKLINDERYKIVWIIINCCRSL